MATCKDCFHWCVCQGSGPFWAAGAEHCYSWVDPNKIVEKKEMTMKIKLDEGAKMPTRSHKWDAGLDLYAKESGYVRVNNSHTFDTGVHVQIPEGYYGEIRSRSGLMCNHGITTDGTIDVGYTGSIRVCLFNRGGNKYYVRAGDKIAQLVIVPCELRVAKMASAAPADKEQLQMAFKITPCYDCTRPERLPNCLCQMNCKIHDDYEAEKAAFKKQRRIDRGLDEYSISVSEKCNKRRNK